MKLQNRMESVVDAQVHFWGSSARNIPFLVIASEQKAPGIGKIVCLPKVEWRWN